MKTRLHLHNIAAVRFSNGCDAALLRILVFVIIAIAGISQCATAGERPNFLLIIADDLCWRDMGWTGNNQVRTPHLDQLATEGLSTTTMFTPATTCSPSRHALYTGLFCVRSGAYPNHTHTFDGTKSIFTHLKEIGYRVALQNKSHVGPPASFPYEHIQSADDLTETEAFVRRDASQPWMLSFASNDPHGPWTRGPAYDPETLSIPPYLHDNATTRELLAKYYGEITKLDQQVGELMHLLDETGQAANTLVLFVSEQGSSFPYGGKWSVYDNGIRVAAIARWPGHVQPESTTTALMQYVDVAPTFLAAAGLDPAQIDTGCPDANNNRGFDGRSFLDVLTGTTTRFRDYVFSQHTTVGINGFQEPYPMRAVRDDRYKLIRNLAPENRYTINGIHKGRLIESWQQDAKTSPELARQVEWLFKRPGAELYDLENDPLESVNLAGAAHVAEVQSRLQTQLDEWMDQQGDHGMETELLAKTRQSKERQEK